MQVSDKAYNPSEPEGVFDKINPYRGSLKYIIENFDKNTWRTLSECAALVVAPAGLLYVKKEFNNVEREVCLEQGKKFREHKFGKDFDHPIYMIETAKTFLAYFLSSSAAKIIWWLNKPHKNKTRNFLNFQTNYFCKFSPLRIITNQ